MTPNKIVEVTLHDTYRFWIAAALDEQSWEWTARIFDGERTTEMRDPAPPANLAARNPNRCIGKAIEWLLQQEDLGILARR